MLGKDAIRLGRIKVGDEKATILIYPYSCSSDFSLNTLKYVESVISFITRDTELDCVDLFDRVSKALVDSKKISFPVDDCDTVTIEGCSIEPIVTLLINENVYVNIYQGNYVGLFYSKETEIYEINI